MKYRRLDKNNDMTFGGGKYDYLTDIDAVAQAVRTKLKLLKEEWWEDIQDGTPFFQQIFNQRVSDEGLNAIDIIIKDRILKVKEVNTILSYESQIDKMNRTYSAQIEIDTIYGIVDNLNIEI